eukprot:TRINITY_DN8807_c0_g1_i4.p1 TRINITY_DN8807_c0_g1~~TRINITY_DN8807_c0_g1_i4.p1  ORF type:complete len:691 (-),score=6.77 TRINITY_DN8807_c0_g1_i4:508-2580(-)
MAADRRIFRPAHALDTATAASTGTASTRATAPTATAPARHAMATVAASFHDRSCVGVGSSLFDLGPSAAANLFFDAFDPSPLLPGGSSAAAAAAGLASPAGAAMWEPTWAAAAAQTAHEEDDSSAFLGGFLDAHALHPSVHPTLHEGFHGHHSMINEHLHAENLFGDSFDNDDSAVTTNSQQLSDDVAATAAASASAASAPAAAPCTSHSSCFSPVSSSVPAHQHEQALDFLHPLDSAPAPFTADAQLSARPQDDSVPHVLPTPSAPAGILTDESTGDDFMMDGGVEDGGAGLDWQRVVQMLMADTCKAMAAVTAAQGHVRALESAGAPGGSQQQPSVSAPASVSASAPAAHYASASAATAAAAAGSNMTVAPPALCGSAAFATSAAPSPVTPVNAFRRGALVTMPPSASLSPDRSTHYSAPAARHTQPVFAGATAHASPPMYASPPMSPPMHASPTPRACDVRTPPAAKLARFSPDRASLRSLSLQSSPLQSSSMQAKSGRFARSDSVRSPKRAGGEDAGSPGGKRRRSTNGSVESNEDLSPQHGITSKEQLSPVVAATPSSFEGPDWLHQLQSGKLQTLPIMLRMETTKDRISLLRQLVAPSISKGDTATVLGEVERFLKGIYAKLGHLTRAENQMQQQQQSAQQQATSTQFDTTSGVSPLSRLGFAIVKRSTAEGLVKKAAMQRLPA